MHTVHLVVLLLILPSSSIVAQDAEAVEPDADTRVAELLNQTYTEKMTVLQKCLTRNYRGGIIPKANIASPMTIKIWSRFMHFSVDEIQQTMEVNGFVYMHWDDYNLKCASKDRAIAGQPPIIEGETTLHLWQVWKPRLVLWNSADAASSLDPIQYDWWTQARVHVSEGKSTVTIFPFLRIKFTCHFDYSDYPYDTQICPATFHLNHVMSDLQFDLTSEQHSTFATDWNEMLGINRYRERHISNWKLTSSRANQSYWRWMGATYERPSEANATLYYSLYNVWFTLQRHAPYHGVMTVLPALMTSLVTIAALAINHTSHAMYILCGNLLIQVLFTQDVLSDIPPSVGATPRIVKYFSFNLCATFVVMCLLVFVQSLRRRDTKMHLILSSLLVLRNRRMSHIPRRTGDEKLVEEGEGDAAAEGIDIEADGGDAITVIEEETTGRRGLRTEEDDNAVRGEWDELADIVLLVAAILIILIYLGFMFVWLK